MSLEKKLAVHKKNKSLKKDTTERKDESNLRIFFWGIKTVSDIGIRISFPLVGGAFFGSFLDTKLTTRPKLTLSFIFVGFILGMYFLYKMIEESKEK